MGELVKDIGSVTKRNELIEVLKKCREVLIGECSVNRRQSWSIYKALLGRLCPSLLGCLRQHEQKEYFDGCFICGPPTDSLLCLVGELSSNGECKGYKLEKICGILLLYFRNRLEKLFTDFCVTDASYPNNERVDGVMSEVVKAIVSCPERLANLCHGQVVFEEETFVRNIAVAVIRTLQVVRLRTSEKRDSSLRFLSQLVCRLYLAGYGSRFLRILIPWLSAKCKTENDGTADFIWRRISENLLTRNLIIGAVEGLLTEILHVAKESDLDGLLGDSVCEQKRIEYLFTSKLFLVRFFASEERMEEKIGTYLASGSRRRKMFLVDTLVRVLEAWASPGSVSHSGLDQRRYICKAVLVLLSKLTDEEKAGIKESVLKLMMEGMELHLASVNNALRIQGMVVGEALTRAVHSSGPCLNFQYDREDAEVKLLVGDRGGSCEEEYVEDISNLIEETEEGTVGTGSISGAVVYDSDDDDFEPFDFSKEEIPQAPAEEDVEECGKKIGPPKYIRECLEGLYEDKDYEKFESCFLACEDLVRKGTVGFGDVAVELVERLLSLENKFSTDNFEIVRLKSLVACCVMKPRDVALYIGSQFYKRNYTITQRLLMLDVLCEAAKELANVSKKREASPAEENESFAPPSELLPSWRLEVEKRLATKTRRFSVRPKLKSEEKAAAPNKFLVFASDFFFPLITGYDTGKCQYLDLLGRDYFVLGRILYTLGTIVFCAQNTPNILSMTEALVGSLWSLRYHQESFVRQGVIYCFSMAIMAMPGETIATTFTGNMSEFKMWLVSVCADDCDDGCRRMASTTSALLAEKMNTGSHAVVGNALVDLVN